VGHFDEVFTKMDVDGSYQQRGSHQKLSDDQWSDFDLDAEGEEDFEDESD
jgi:hypothetical protein